MPATGAERHDGRAGALLDGHTGEVSGAWAIVASGAIAAVGAVGAAWATSVASRSAQVQSGRAELERTIRGERRDSYLQLSTAVAARVSALRRYRDRKDEPSWADAEAANAEMWRAYRAVRLTGPRDAAAAALKLVEHYGRVDRGGWPERGGSELERNFFRVAQVSIGTGDGVTPPEADSSITSDQ